MCIVGDWRVCEAEFQNELITAHSEGMPRRVVTLIRAGGDVTRYWHWRALRTFGVFCVEDMSISHKSIKMTIFAVFALCDYKREKRGRATDSVIPLMDLPCLSYDCYFIPRFFLVNRDPHGKIEKFAYGASEISHKSNSHPSWAQPKEEEPICA